MNELDLLIKDDQKTALVINQNDNVAIALSDLQQGDTCTLRIEGNEEKVVVGSGINFGHKFARVHLTKNERVFKYGEEIGRMIHPVDQGEWIHTHNMYCERGLKQSGR